MISRRAFVAGSVTLLAAPLGAEAQQQRVYKIGYLGLGAGPTHLYDASISRRTSRTRMDRRAKHRD